MRYKGTMFNSRLPRVTLTPYHDILPIIRLNRRAFHPSLLSLWSQVVNSSNLFTGQFVNSDAAVAGSTFLELAQNLIVFQVLIAVLDNLLLTNLL